MATSKNYNNIITSTIDISYSSKHIVELIKKINGLPISELEVEPGALDLVNHSDWPNYGKTTAMINYPLGGYTEKYIFDCLQWVVKKRPDVICVNMPLVWIKARDETRIINFLRKISKYQKQNILRIAFDSDLISLDELMFLCENLDKVEIFNIKISCGTNQISNEKVIRFSKDYYPDFEITVDNGLTGKSHQIDVLFENGVHNVCVRNPWLYHF